MKNSTRFVANLAKWSRGMIRALGARGPGFESPFGPHILLTAKTANYISSCYISPLSECTLDSSVKAE